MRRLMVYKIKQRKQKSVHTETYAIKFRLGKRRREKRSLGGLLNKQEAW